MIDYIDIERLGFYKSTANDTVYERQYGRQLYWMEYRATIIGHGFKHEILFNWDCDSRIVRAFKNDTEQVAEFIDWESFIKYFSIFQK